MIASSDKVRIEVVCLGCGEIYWRMVERDFAESPTARRVSGYLPIMCKSCSRWRNKNNHKGGKNG